MAITLRCVGQISPRRPVLFNKGWIRVEDQTYRIIVDSRDDRHDLSVPPLDRQMRQYSMRLNAKRGVVEIGGVVDLSRNTNRGRDGRDGRYQGQDDQHSRDAHSPVSNDMVLSLREIDIRKHRPMFCTTHNVQCVPQPSNRFGTDFTRRVVCPVCKCPPKQWRLGFFSSKDPGNTTETLDILRSLKTVDAGRFPEVASAIEEMEEHLDDVPGYMFLPRVYITSHTTPAMRYDPRFVADEALMILRGNAYLEQQVMPFGFRPEIEYVEEDEGDGSGLISRRFELTSNDGREFHAYIPAGFSRCHYMKDAKPGTLLYEIQEPRGWPDLETASAEQPELVKSVMSMVHEEAVVQIADGLVGVDIRYAAKVPADARGWVTPVHRTFAIHPEYLRKEARPFIWDLVNVPEEWKPDSRKQVQKHWMPPQQQNRQGGNPKGNRNGHQQHRRRPENNHPAGERLRLPTSLAAPVIASPAVSVPGPDFTEEDHKAAQENRAGALGVVTVPGAQERNNQIQAGRQMSRED